jgi:hypothetical protein
MATFNNRIKSAWNAFSAKEKDQSFIKHDPQISHAQMRTRRAFGNERSMLASILTRISTDAASIDVRHVRLDDNDRFLREETTYLNECFKLSPNLDQTSDHFFRDIYYTMLDKGHVVIVPVDLTLDPSQTAGYDIKSLRVGYVSEWYPKQVKVSVYDESAGERKDVMFNKEFVAISENPFYEVMNTQNSTFQRLIRKLSLLDGVDEAAASGKMDLIIQLPYIVKSDTKRQQAEKRRDDLEVQMRGSKYGIGYIDGTERITQLNRPVENSLPQQIQYLTDQLYAQLGITSSILDGTASETVVLNYQNQTVLPIVTAVVNSMRRTFLTKTARTQKQDIKAFRDPFKLVPLANIAEIADKFTRNEIMSSNEIRQVIGMKPSEDPKADELRNANMPDPDIENTQANMKEQEKPQNET